MTLDDLRRVPVTTKGDIRASGMDKSIADWADPSSLIPTKTSGSSGKPFTVYRTASELRVLGMINIASLMSTGFRPLDRLAALGLPADRPRQLHHRLGLFRREVIPLSLPLDSQIRRLKDFQPTILLAYPTALRALMHRLETPLRELISPRMLITAAEVCDEVLRRQVEADLGVELFNFFAANETGPIAWECPSHEGLHVNADYLIIECLDGERPAGFGNTGTAVVTSLFCFAMPLIRYKLGDLIALSNGRCSCGSPLPLVSHPRGRDNDMLKLPSGTILSPNRFQHILCEFPGIDQWQVIQESEDRLVLKLVMPEMPEEAILAEMRAQFLEYLEERVSLDIQLVGYMEEDGKFRTFISKVSPRDS